MISIQQKVSILVFPVLILMGIWGSTYIDQNYGGKTWEIKISGYDPRDILYGHYLRYKFDLPPSHSFGGQDHPSESFYICFNRSKTGEVDPDMILMNELDHRHCESVVRVYKKYGDFSFQKSGVSEKYFIPEEYAAVLDKTLREGQVKMRVKVRIKDDGSFSKGELTIDGMPMAQFVE